MAKETFPEIAQTGSATVTWNDKNYDFLDGRLLLTKYSDQTRTRLQALQVSNSSKPARQIVLDVLSRGEQLSKPIKTLFKTAPHTIDFKFHIDTSSPLAEPASKKRKTTESANDDNAKKPRTESQPDALTKEDSRAVNDAKQIFDVLALELPGLGNCPLLSTTKFAHLQRIVEGLKAHQPASSDVHALLALSLRGWAYSALATKALTESLGQDGLKALVKRAEVVLQAHNIADPRSHLFNTNEFDGRVERAIASRAARQAASTGATPTDSRRASVSSTGTIMTINTRASVASVVQPTTSSMEDGEIASSRPPAMDLLNTRTDIRLHELSPDDQLLQQRYFSLTDPDALVICRNCHNRGHVMTSCPNVRSPAQQKCLRCRQRGHTAESCTSMSVPAGGIGDECDECGNHGHAEGECSYLWHNVRPKRVRRTQISEITDKIFCSLCGRKGHYARTCANRVRPHRNIPSFFTVEVAFLAALEDVPNPHATSKDYFNYRPSRNYPTHVLDDDSDEEASHTNGTMPAWQVQQLSNFE